MNSNVTKVFNNRELFKIKTVKSCRQKILIEWMTELQIIFSIISVMTDFNNVCREKSP